MADETLEGGSGDPAGASPEGEQGKPPGNGEWIPKARFDEAIGALKDEIRELKSTKQPAQNQEPPKRYTRAQLREAVTAGQITQDQADDIWDNQLLEQAATVGRDSATQAERERRIDGDIAQYKRLKPEVMQDGHADRLRVRDEFNYLVSLGHPKTKETELAAMRAAFGPLDRLQAAKQGRPGAEYHQEAGGGGGGRPQNRDTGKLVDTQSDREKKYYQSLIDKGIYKDWNEVEAILQHAKPHIRRKHGASV